MLFKVVQLPKKRNVKKRRHRLTVTRKVMNGFEEGGLEAKL